MANWNLFVRLRRKLSWTAAISILLTLVAIIPLLVTIVSSQMLSRPQLMAQSAEAMAQDARVRVQLINAYLLNRLRDIQTVSALGNTRAYVQGNNALREDVLATLAATYQNDINYDSWSLLDPQGEALLWYPIKPKKHGNYLIPPKTLEQVRHLTGGSQAVGRDAADQLQLSTRAYFSDVYYDPGLGLASIVIYMPILEAASKVVGIVRTEITLNYIWGIVNSQADSIGSYAIIVDRHGVRIAYSSRGGSTLTRSKYLFTAVAPLTPEVQDRLKVGDIYAGTEMPVKVVANPALARMMHDPHAPSRCEMVPVGQQEPFEVVRVHISMASWTYFALRPLKSIISIADQQLESTLLIAMIALCLAVVIGLMTGRRITQPILRSMEQEHRAYVQQQNLNQLKDQILLNVSHELRTPLTEVYGYIELLGEYYGRIDDETTKTFIKRATAGCEELQLLINDVLATVRADEQTREPQLQNVSIAQAVRDTLELFDPRTVQNYELQIAVPEELVVRANQQYLRQILRNLLSNAFKYTPSRTALHISATPLPRASEEDDSVPLVCICVKDSGPGIPPEDIPFIFEKFRRLERDLSSSIRGVGLGLYLTRQMVEAMGGQIWAESKGIAGEGSRFCFTLPLAPGPVCEPKAYIDAGSSV